MAESAGIFLLNQLSIWLKEEQKLLGGLSGEVQLIRGELEQKKVFLRAADAREEDDPQAKEWVRQIREIAYDTQDVLESYMLKFDGRHSHGARGRMRKIYAWFNLKAKHQMASEIKALRSRAENASKTFKDLHEVIPTGTSYGARANSTWHDGRSDALRLEKADVVGIERPKKQLLEWISTTKYPLKVVSVVGMAGLGKTTLVKQLYDDPSVKKNIDYHAWINVSERYTVENLLQRLIKQLQKEVKQASPPRLETMNADDLREFIYNFLKDKNYLIVLDDIWSANAWDALRYAFPRSTTHGHGCIIITTRSRNVGNAACCENGGYVYALQPLSPEKAEELFQKRHLGGSNHVLFN